MEDVDVQYSGEEMDAVEGVAPEIGGVGAIREPPVSHH